MRVVFVIFAAVAALALAGSASAGQSYLDPSGEVPGSADISGVSVSDDGNSATFQVQTSWGDMDANTFFAILIDSDKNASTGTGGFDYVVTGNRYGGTVVNTTNPLVLNVPSTYGGGLWTVTVPAGDIGGSHAFNFFVLTQVGGDQAHPSEDRAPDTGTWQYPAAAAAPPPTAKLSVASVAATYAGAPMHGKVFRVTALAVGLSDGSKASASGLTCSARLGTDQLVGTGAGGCVFHLPKRSKGQRLAVTIAGSYGATPVTRTYAFRVR